MGNDYDARNDGSAEIQARKFSPPGSSRAEQKAYEVMILNLREVYGQQKADDAEMLRAAESVFGKVNRSDRR